MKRAKWVRRWEFTKHILTKIQIIETLGGYMLIGEWRDYIYHKHNMLVKHYNKSRFWWQKPKKAI